MDERNGRQKMKAQEGAGEEELVFPAGLKWTRQRRNVYRVLQEAEEPLSAAQIYRLTEELSGGGEYAVSTVYRILAVFEEKGFVEKSAWSGDGTAVYGLNRGGHTHYTVCLACRRRIPLRSCPFARLSLEQQAGECTGFVVTGHKLEIYGYCRDCREP